MYMLKNISNKFVNLRQSFYVDNSMMRSLYSVDSENPRHTLDLKNPAENSE
jgi:hypothetical protein